jgi:hypothetical protein
VLPLHPTQGYKTLNRIQSRIFNTAYRSNENVLVCAPTGQWDGWGRVWRKGAECRVSEKLRFRVGYQVGGLFVTMLPKV